MSEVAFKNKAGIYCIGEVIEEKEDELVVWLWDELDEIVVRKNEVIESKEIYITKEKAIDLLCGNISFDEEEVYPYNTWVIDDNKISLSFNQLETSIKYLSSLNDKEPWFRFFKFCVCCDVDSIIDINKINEVALTYMILKYINEEQYNEIIEYANNFFSKKDVPLIERFPETELQKFILKSAFDLDGKYVDELNEVLYSYLVKEEFDEDKEVIFMRAYSYYGGNSFCPCDYKKSEENLLILYANGDIFAANSLGYIYYYGRVNNGVGQYDLAYKYFSVAAFSREPEAIIKISDMYKNGYYVDQNYQVAFRMLDDIYYEQLKLLETDHPNKFADIALRFGTMFENGYYVDKDFELAMKFYMFARVAITLRERYYYQFGDKSVKNAIDKSLQRMEKQKFNWSSNKNKEYILTRYIYRNSYNATIKYNKKKETVIHLKNEYKNKKIIIDLKNKKGYFSDRISLIIKAEQGVLLDNNKPLKITIYSDFIYLENESIAYSVPFKNIKIKLYDEIRSEEIVFND